MCSLEYELRSMSSRMNLFFCAGKQWVCLLILLFLLIDFTGYVQTAFCRLYFE
jgi:hypothetical protein